MTSISQQMAEMMESIESEGRLRGIKVFMGIPERVGSNRWSVLVRLDEWDEKPWEVPHEEKTDGH